ncbi:MAG: polyphosphate polymerase domain-containing protein [Lachnospiraceae bacterium]|nr:polyphosphate polymerase domain-containing protein [Lachnospiraceae bacterium]
MNKLKKCRREIKFELSKAEYLVAKNRIALLLDCDKNAGKAAGKDGYFVRSIYFDDLRETAFTEKVNGVFDRRKFRIRTYNNDLGFIKLECKEKFNRWISKKSARIDEKACESLLNCDFPVSFANEEGVLKEFYFAAKESGLRPVIGVDYYREAFIYPASNLRITFDRQLRASCLSEFAIVKPKEKEEFSVPAYHNDSVVMEIKFDDFMPEIVRAVIPYETGKPLAISKYRMCMSIRKALKI